MASVTLRPDKQSYQIRVSRGYDSNGKQLTPYTKTYKCNPNLSDEENEQAAEAEKIRFEEACKRGEVEVKKERKKRLQQAQEEERKKPTLKAYAEYYIQTRRDLEEEAINTIRTSKYCLKQLVEKYGDYKMEDITSVMMDDYITSIKMQKNSVSGELLKTSTVKTYYAHLQSFFAYAKKHKVINASPMAEIDTPSRRKNEAMEEEKVYKIADIQNLVRAMDKEPIRWRAMLRFNLDTGCRVGELLGLKWKDLNFETGEVTIRDNLQRNKIDHTFYTTTPKNGKIRTFPVNREVLAIMKEWKKAQLEHLMKKGLLNGIPEEERYIFTSKETGDHFCPEAYAQYLERFGKKYGFEGIHPHEFRHMMASMMVASKVDPVTAQKRLGHAKISTTLKYYSHLTEEKQQEGARALADLLYREA